MQTQQSNGITEGRAPPVRSWRLLLLILLVVLPATVALASPEPFHAPSATAEQHDAEVHAHGPSDTPVCHHAADYANSPALVSDNRNVDLPASGDPVATDPNQGPEHNHLNVAGEPRHAAPSDDLPPTLAVYLQTQRLRV